MTETEKAAYPKGRLVADDAAVAVAEPCEALVSGLPADSERIGDLLPGSAGLACVADPADGVEANAVGVLDRQQVNPPVQVRVLTFEQPLRLVERGLILAAGVGAPANFLQPQLPTGGVPHRPVDGALHLLSRGERREVSVDAVAGGLLFARRHAVKHDLTSAAWQGKP